VTHNTKVLLTFIAVYDNILFQYSKNKVDFKMGNELKNYIKEWKQYNKDIKQLQLNIKNARGNKVASLFMLAETKNPTYLQVASTQDGKIAFFQKSLQERKDKIRTIRNNIATTLKTATKAHVKKFGKETQKFLYQHRKVLGIGSVLTTVGIYFEDEIADFTSEVLSSKESKQPNPSSIKPAKTLMNP
jgi:hypothetical protein